MTASQLPPGLNDFGDRMQDAAHREIRREQRLRRRRRIPRLVVTVSLGTLAAGAVAGASGLILRDGSPIDADPIPTVATPPPDPAVVASSARADPAGGPPWALRVFENGAGETCVRVGRLRRGVLGQFRGTTFRALPTDAPSLCGVLRRERVLFTLERRGGPQPRTLVYGVSVGRQPLKLRLGGVTRSVEPGARGTFLFVLPGAGDPRGAVLSTIIDGKSLRQRLG